MPEVSNDFVELFVFGFQTTCRYRERHKRSVSVITAVHPRNPKAIYNCGGRRDRTAFQKERTAYKADSDT